MICYGNNIHFKDKGKRGAPEAVIRRTHQINTDTRELNNSREKQARTNLKQRVLAGLCAFCLVVLQCFVLGTALPEKAYAANGVTLTVKAKGKEFKKTYSKSDLESMKDSGGHNAYVVIMTTEDDPATEENEAKEIKGVPLEVVKNNFLAEDTAGLAEAYISKTEISPSLSETDTAYIVPESESVFKIYKTDGSGVFKDIGEFSKCEFTAKDEFTPIR